MSKCFKECAVETSPENALILYDTLDVKDVITEGKEVEVVHADDIEIKEVYFGEYLNQCDTIEDENTVLINEDASHEEGVQETIANDVLSVQSVSDTTKNQHTNTEDIQISQIVESSNVSLR